MTPANLARVHAAAFAPARGWSAAEFADLCASPHVRLYTRDGGFALLRAVAGEAELLTLAVLPDQRRRGVADALMQAWMSSIEAETAFLEVAQDNHAARALYVKHGFSEVTRRKAYYKRAGGASVDAVLMRATLTHRHKAESHDTDPKTG